MESPQDASFKVDLTNHAAVKLPRYLQVRNLYNQLLSFSQ
jgi:hypothetical protein